MVCSMFEFSRGWCATNTFNNIRPNNREMCCVTFAQITHFYNHRSIHEIIHFVLCEKAHTSVYTTVGHGAPAQNSTICLNFEYSRFDFRGCVFSSTNKPCRYPPTTDLLLGLPLCFLPHRTRTRSFNVSVSVCVCLCVDVRSTDAGVGTHILWVPNVRLQIKHIFIGMPVGSGGLLCGL